jgi:hypothetical protein
MCLDFGTKVAEVALEIAVHPAGTLVGFSVCWLHTYHWYLKVGFPAQSPGEAVKGCPDTASPESIGTTKLATLAITIGDDAE